MLLPVLGLVLGFTHAKAPRTLAEPPDNPELASVCPYVIEAAVGQLLMTGVPRAITNVDD
jgi:hypothetical protein